MAAPHNSNAIKGFTNLISEYINPVTMAYFYGRLLEEEAEEILLKRSQANKEMQNGLFLLRETIEEIGSYFLSILYENQIIHYRIERLSNSQVALRKENGLGKPFIGPIELIKYYQIEQDGLVIKPTIPCNRPIGIQPIYYLFISNSELYDKVNEEIEQSLEEFKEKGEMDIYRFKLKEAMSIYRYKYERDFMKKMLITISWFKDSLDGYKAKKILKNYKKIDGTFLVRTIKKNGENLTFLSINIKKKMYNFKIISNKEKFYLDADFETCKFDSIIQLIDFYHRCVKDLPCKLVTPDLQFNDIDKKNFCDFEDKTIQINDSNFNYNKLMNQLQSGGFNDSENVKLEKTDTDAFKIELEKNFSNQNLLKTKQYNVFYNEIDYNDLIFNEKLGEGAFGEVYKGTYNFKFQNNLENPQIPVAIKKLKKYVSGTNEKLKKDVSETNEELKKEADIMKSLNNPHIIKYMGMSFDNNKDLLIVLEYAKLGPLNKYLKNNPEVSMSTISEICYQIAKGMEYLVSKGIVHRDLAARNVLLVKKDMAKVSDFGLSRLMDTNQYYQTDLRNNKWPFRWFSPETMSKGKFDEKSDIWSCGITFWEATSYGSFPYSDIKHEELLPTMLATGHRLEKPIKCPDKLWNLIEKCWKYDKDSRINFSGLVKKLRSTICDLYGVILS